MTKKARTILIVIVVGLVGFAAYHFFLKPDVTPIEDTLLLVDDTGMLDSPAGQEVLSLLSQLRSIQLDTTVFETLVFKSLIDRRVELEEQPMGRSNPFVTVGTDAPLSPSPRPQGTTGTSTPGSSIDASQLPEEPLLLPGGVSTTTQAQ